MTDANKVRLELLLQVASDGGAFQSDLLTLLNRTGSETVRFKSGRIDFDYVAFWHKSLVRTFFVAVDGTCLSIRQAIANRATALGVPFSASQLKELKSSGPRMNVYRSSRLAFESFARVFEIDFRIDPSGSDWKGFARLAAARASLTHPYRWQDVYPFHLFPSTHPGIEWFLFTWRSLLEAASSALRLPLGATAAPSRRHFFSEEQLVAFEQRQSEIEGERASSSWVEDLGDVVHPLHRETSWALEVISASLNENAEIAFPSAIRLFARTLFSRIEGVVLAADRARGRQTQVGYFPSNELVRGGSEEVRERMIVTLEGFSKSLGRAHRVRRDGAGYLAFVEARGLRNRYTHPSSVSALSAGASEFNTLNAVLGWWLEDLERCLLLR